VIDIYFTFLFLFASRLSVAAPVKVVLIVIRLSRIPLVNVTQILIRINNIFADPLGLIFK